jgi:hypothetical protein
VRALQGPVVTIPEPEQVFGPWQMIRELQATVKDLDKRLQEVERQAYLLRWLVGVFGTVGVSLMTAILVKLIV